MASSEGKKKTKTIEKTKKQKKTSLFDVILRIW